MIRLAALLALAAGAALAAASPAAADDAAPRAAADALYGRDAMAAARRAAQAESGAQTTYFLEAERLEYRFGEGSPGLLFDGGGWWGGDRDKLRVKAEGEYDLNGHGLEEAELQALWSHAISPFFDLQAGIRRDFEPDPARSFAVISLEGLAPYWIEIDAAAFLSDDGELSARIEAEYELLLTQRLVLQPRVELDFAATSTEELGIGSGLSTAELGLRLRYEIRRAIAPYIGVSWSRAVGETADFARAAGEDPERASLVVGLRAWF